ncbi:MAG TPA: hypothetical protein VE988_15640 [Gemmataceae bacterium]|nr:hypothetical protein [Gemmataceae bacterium]
MLPIPGNPTNYAMFTQGKQIAKGSYTINNKIEPNTIDLTILEDNDKGKIQHGILKIDVNQLTMAVIIACKDRPKTFDPVANVAIRELKQNT